MAFFESHSRTLLKTISWKIVAGTITFAAIYYSTRDWVTSLGITVSGTLVSAVAYYVHERIWNGIHWGRHHR